MHKIGSRIKQARKNKNITQQHLANKCNISKSMVSKIENGKINTTLSTLSKISKLLEVSISWVLNEDVGSDFSIIKAKNNNEDLGSKSSGYTFKLLANRFPFSKVEPTIITLFDNMDIKKRYSHDEDEFIYILSGEIIVKYDKEEYYMSEGDSAYFSGKRPHVFSPKGENIIKILVVYIESY